MSLDFVSHEQELADLERSLVQLRIDAKAEGVLLIDLEGRVLASGGTPPDLDIPTIAKIVAGHAESSPTDTVVEQSEVVVSSGDVSALVFVRVVDALLLVLYGQRTTQGLVRLRVKKFQPDLERLLEAFR